jgi:hypothetical protein
MRAEDRVVTSPLSRSLHIHGKHMTITVFKGILLEDDWLFDVTDDEGNLNVSPDAYDTDRDALDAALRSLRSSH